MFPESTAYHISITTFLPGGRRLDEAEVEELASVLARRHWSLRAVVTEAENRAFLTFEPDLRPDVKHFTAGSEKEFKNYVDAELSKPFNLASGPLFRAINVNQQDEKTQIITWVFHHLICDGISLETLSEEVLLWLVDPAQLPVEVPGEAVDYSDYLWHASQTKLRDRDALYWRAQLSDFASRLQLPIDGMADSRKKSCAAFNLKSPPDLMRRVDDLSNQFGTTAFVVLLAAFAVLVRNVSDAEDFVVGIPLAGRNALGLRRVVGFFVNTAPIRFQFIALDTFIAVIKDCKSKVSAALRHQGYPYQNMIEDSKLRCEPFEFPLTSVLFNMLNLRDSQAQMFLLEPGHRSLPMDAKIEQDWYVLRQEDSIVIDCHYSTSQFAPETIEYMVARYFRLLASLMDQAEVPLSTVADPLTEIPKFSDSFRAQPNRPSTPIAAFEKIAIEYSEKIAVWDIKNSLSYASLDKARLAFAETLRAEGVVAGSIVALVCEHNVTMVVAVLAVLSLNAIYVPIDARTPQSRRDLILNDSGAEFIVKPENLVAPEQRRGSIQNRAMLPASNLTKFPLAGPSQACEDVQGGYILYTSGSTGVPKGVVQTATGALHFVAAYQMELDINSRDHLTLLAPFSFDAAFIDIFGALTIGAKLAVLDVQQGSDKIFRAVAETGITVMHSTPTVFRSLIVERKEKKPLLNVRFFVLGGETVGNREMELFRAVSSPAAQLVNLYGASECSIASMKRFRHLAAPAEFPAEIGSGSAGCDLMLQRNGKAVGPLVEGEILVHSRHLAIRYHNRPELDDRFFVDDSGRRWYRSGDLAVRRPDGTLRVVGRALHHAKINGIRVDFSEVERVAKAFDKVIDVVAGVHPGTPAALVLVCSANDEILESDLRTHLMTHLPLSMCPAVIYFVEAMPRTTSGKVDRIAVMGTLGDIAREAKNLARALTPLESEIGCLVAEVLGFDSIGVDQNLLLLGTNSLQAMTILSHVKLTCGVELSVRDLLLTPTVRDLAARVEASTLTSTLSSYPNASGFVVTL